MELCNIILPNFQYVPLICYINKRHGTHNMKFFETIVLSTSLEGHVRGQYIKYTVRVHVHR